MKTKQKSPSTLQQTQTNTHFEHEQGEDDLQGDINPPLGLYLEPLVGYEVRPPDAYGQMLYPLGSSGDAALLLHVDPVKLAVADCRDLARVVVLLVRLLVLLAAGTGCCGLGAPSFGRARGTWCPDATVRLKTVAVNFFQGCVRGIVARG